MSTLREIVYSVKEQLLQYSDDSNISNEHIAFLVKNDRSLLISQRFSNRSYIIPQKLRQHFYKELELADSNEFFSGIDTILRTKDPIQYPLEPFNFKTNIKINSGSYTDINFTLISPDRFPYVGNFKWTQGQIYVTIGSDFRLYFTSGNPSVKLLENVKVSMVMEDPELAYPETIYYNPAIDFWDTQYPMEELMVTQVTDMIVKKLTSSLLKQEDKTNDADSNP